MNPEQNIRKIVMTAAAVSRWTSVIDASAQGKLKVGFVYLGPVGVSAGPTSTRSAGKGS
jgi:hypothetical protein